MGRARISCIEATGAATNTDAGPMFLKWRPKPASAGRRTANRAGNPSPTSNLVALDRINSDQVDFLHPQLLHDYTESVFWLDSRFYQPPAPYTGNAWLRDYLGRSRHGQLAAALMGLTWQVLKRDVSRLINLEFTRPLVTLHSLVMEGVRHDIERSNQLARGGPLAEGELLATAASLTKSTAILLIFEV